MLKGFLRRKSDVKGSVAIITALLAPLFIGGLAIVIDTSYWRYRSSVLQTAADNTAVSLAIDLSNSITAVATLTANATAEASKNGCTSSCTVTVTYPYKTDTSAVAVTLTDTNASRFFSGIYTTSSKTLTAQASGKTSTGGSGGGTRGGSACILAVMATPPSGSGRGVEVQGASTNVSGCEVMSNATGSSSIYGDAGGKISGRATAVGQLTVINGASVGLARPNQPVTPDPYATLYQNSNASNPLRRAQFGTQYVAPSAVTGACMETVTSGNLSSIQWANDLSTGLQGLNAPATHGYSTSIDPVSGNRIHNLGGGGGVFCQDFSTSSVTINLGPGVWYFVRSMTMSNTIINATTANSSAVIPLQIPSVGGQSTNGVTIVLSDGNWGFTGTSEIHIRAPTTGPLAGIAFTNFVDLGGNYIEFANTVLAEYSGAIYLPGRYLRIQNSGRFYSLAGSDGTAATGCSQIVAGSISFLNNVIINNNCSGYGLQPFGTDTTTGWYTASGGGTGIKGRLIP